MKDFVFCCDKCLHFARDYILIKIVLFGSGEQPAAAAKSSPVIPLGASRERDAGVAGRHSALSQAKCLNVTYDNKRFSDVIV